MRLTIIFKPRDILAEATKRTSREWTPKNDPCFSPKWSITTEMQLRALPCGS